MLSRGQVTSLAIKAVDSALAGQFSRYRITVRPVHGIPS